MRSLVEISSRAVAGIDAGVVLLCKRSGEQAHHRGLQALPQRLITEAGEIRLVVARDVGLAADWADD